MQSTQMSLAFTGVPALVLLRLPSHSQLAVHAAFGVGVNALFETCPLSATFLNITAASDVDWDCPLSFFSNSNPSSLTFLSSSRFQIGAKTSVQINAVVSSDVSKEFVRDSQPQHIAYWSNVFNMQITAEALIASNILLEYVAQLSNCIIVTISNCNIVTISNTCDMHT
jgi:hypothetical protein